jgi:hypothetical protein
LMFSFSTWKFIKNFNFQKRWKTNNVTKNLFDFRNEKILLRLWKKLRKIFVGKVFALLRWEIKIKCREYYNALDGFFFIFSHLKPFF